MELVYLIPQLVLALPAVVIPIVGVLLLRRRRERLTPRAVSLGTAGLGVLLADAVGNVGYLAALPQIARGGRLHDVQILLGGASLLFVVLHALGLALVVAALVSAAQPAGPWDQARPEFG